MAEEAENDDQWLYGNGDNPDQEAVGSPNLPDDQQDSGDISQNEPQPSEVPENDQPEEDISQDVEDQTDQIDAEDGEVDQNDDGDEKDDLDDDDSDDDDVNVVIGDIKTTASTYTQQPLNIKRGGLTTTIGDKSKSIQQSGKFNVEEFEQIGTINGISAIDYNLDSLEDKPWRKPGADITDYFNYGFNEDTWKAYCERQKRMRINESGVGLAPLNAIGLPRGPINIINDNAKYTSNNQQRPAAVPAKPGELPKVNTIQVMTADRREYSRKPGSGAFPDMSMPPPAGFPDFQPEYGFNPEPEPFYGGGYEPTQDSQWMESMNAGWAPSEIKTLTGGPPPMGPPPVMQQPGGMIRSPSRHSPSREKDRERESRSRSERPRDRERERSYRRDRSRSKSKRYRSRSRSPSHRSHRKKKSSRRHEDSD